MTLRFLHGDCVFEPSCELVNEGWGMGDLILAILRPHLSSTVAFRLAPPTPPIRLLSKRVDKDASRRILISISGETEAGKCRQATCQGNAAPLLGSDFTDGADDIFGQPSPLDPPPPSPGFVPYNMDRRYCLAPSNRQTRSTNELS